MPSQHPGKKSAGKSTGKGKPGALPPVKKASVLYALPGKGKTGSGQPGENFITILRAVKKPENQMTALEKMALVEEGISKSDLESLKAKAGLDYEQLARVLSVARATLINKKSPEKFNTDLSDKIMGLADIYAYGFEVFGDPEHFNNWLQRPNRALGGRVPFELLHTSFGREEVKNLVGRIDYGVYS